MKIDIITLHRVRNYGSSLQTLAFQKVLERKGCLVEIIDYYPERYKSFGLLKRLKNKSEYLKRNPLLLFIARMIISVSYIKKKIVFDGFLKRYINISPKTYRNENELETDFPQADAYCTGSDQVWNSLWNEGIDKPFYLSFVPTERYKFSYAASIGNSKLSEEEITVVKPYFKQYNHITVRENTGVEIMARMSFQNVKQVLDPTLLLGSNEWNKYTSDKFRKRKYIVTYNLHHDRRIDEYAAMIAKKNSLPVYHISYNIHDIVRNGKLKWCPKIEEYLGLIRDAQFVITDSFHAAVFSLLFHTKFIVIYPEHSNSRIRSILELLEIPGRGMDCLPSPDQIMEEIHFDKIDSKLNIERKKSMNYLDMVLNEIADQKGTA